MTRETALLLAVVMMLALIGVLMVYSADAVESGGVHLKRQLAYVAIGILAMTFTFWFGYERLHSPFVYQLLVLIGLTLLILVLIPGIGDERGGAQRWIKVAGMTFQPSEFAKFPLLILLAVKISENHHNIRKFWKGVVPPMIISGVFAGLILLEKDLGVPVLIVSVTLLVLLMAGASLWHVGVWLIPGGAGAFVLCATSEYRWSRLVSFLDPWQYRDDASFQLIQSLAGFAHGGVWGRGPGAGEQKLNYLPEANNDFIFPLWGEEMGLVGTLAMVVLFVTFLVMGLRIAMCAKDLFGAILAASITTLIATQAACNMGVTLGLLPTKGLPLPFISAGGSALIATMAMMGVLLNIGIHAEQPQRGWRMLVWAR